MSSFGLNVPAEMLWLMLSFPSVLFFPEAFAFVASCEHRFFLVFVPGEAVDVSQGEEGYAPIERLMPRLLSVLDAKNDGSPLFLHKKFVRPTRTHPFNRRNYDADAICSFLDAYVRNLDRLVDWMCEATNFVANSGEFDLDFALQNYLTVYLLLHTTYRIAIEQRDMFSRKMGVFDVLELYAGLMDCSTPPAQAMAWRTHLESAFVAQVTATLRRYPAPFDDDFAASVQQLMSDNAQKIDAGLIFGKSSDGTRARSQSGRLRVRRIRSATNAGVTKHQTRLCNKR